MLVTIAPLLALGLAVQYVEYENDRAVANERTVELARGVALQVSREIEGDIRALQVLAKTGRLRRGAIEAFRELAESALTDRLEGANIMVIDERGQQLLNTALPPGTVLPQTQSPENTRQVFATGQLRVSDVYFGSIVKRPAVAIEVPVKDATGRVMYTLTLDPRPDTFADIIRRQGARKGVVIALIDRVGTVIARWPDSNKYAGQKVVPELLARLKDAPETTFETRTFEGTSVMTAVSRVDAAGWTVAIGTPHAEYLGPLWSSVAVIVGATLLLLLIGFALARLVAHQITKPIEALVTYADNAATSPPPEATGLRETDGLAAAIRRYAEGRTAAEHELTQLNATLEQRVGAAVAERNDAQARLVEAQKMEAVGQLTAGIAHDFNNLLTAIIGSLDLMRKDFAGNARLATLSEIADQAAQRGAMLVSQLLAFGRRQTLQPQSVRVEHALADVRLLIGPAAGGEVVLTTEIAPGLWACFVDRAQLDSAILNLVFNAHDAMPRGGALTIVAENRAIDAGRARTLDVAAGDYVRIAVSDTGAGMSPETVQRAFEPFFTTKGVGRGSGLGLSQVWGFAKQSGGTATIDSRPGEGTTVALLLPRASAEPAPPAVDETAPHPVSPKRILVVEDSKEVRALAQSLLEDLGHEAIVAPHAEGALAILSGEQSIDLLFCDVALSGPIDGRKLAELARQMRPGLKVLMTTGYPDLLRGPSGSPPIIAKPYHQTDLAAKLMALFDA
ncbi:MAG: response regulator [Reyranella sp.]|uniref:hybrid sensor histidine kinase/response regulator n=1 Tax=Reyranella sp. TaxID=1929291 RepID=UPI001AD3D579|nr:ATP-binding protein [Reyranella sp.]MBN9088060.1 response regulator [Reyranella sp.]